MFYRERTFRFYNPTRRVEENLRQGRKGGIKSYSIVNTPALHIKQNINLICLTGPLFLRHSGDIDQRLEREEDRQK